MSSLSILVGFSMIASVICYFEQESFVILLSARETTCLSKGFVRNSKAIFEYHVTDGGNRDIDAKVVSPNGMVIYKELQTNGDEISFLVTNGDFKFCFSNEFSRFLGKRVVFNIRPFNPASLSELIGEDGPTVKNSYESLCDDIFNLMAMVSEYQSKHRIREATGRFIAENLNKRVLNWSMFQAVLIFLTGFGQVIIFKRFFNEKKQAPLPEPTAEHVITT